MNVSIGDKYTITHADSPVFTSFDNIPLAKDDIIEVIKVDDEDKFNKLYLISIEGKEGTFEVPHYFFLLVEKIEKKINNGQDGGKRRKHRKTRHRKMKRSKTTKRKVRR